jgi:hypothetical protein
MESQKALDPARLQSFSDDGDHRDPVDVVLRLPRCAEFERCRFDHSGSMRCVYHAISGRNWRPKGRMDGWKKKGNILCGASFFDAFDGVERAL